MKKSEPLNTELLIELVNQLADISGWLVKECTSIDASYEKYQSFYIPATETLKEFGIRLKYNGYAYILEAVKILIERNTFDVRLNADVYPVIALKYHIDQADSIEHNIRNAIGAAYRANERCPGCNMMKIFDRKPTNKQFLMHIADSVRYSMMENRILSRNAG